MVCMPNRVLQNFTDSARFLVPIDRRLNPVTFMSDLPWKAPAPHHAETLLDQPTQLDDCLSPDH
jgi:hypothetical protein